MGLLWDECFYAQKRMLVSEKWINFEGIPAGVYKNYGVV